MAPRTWSVSPVRTSGGRWLTVAQDPLFIDSYILQEQAAGRLSEGFEPMQLQKQIGNFRTAPLGLTPKPGSDEFRMIEDLSFPRTDLATASVNAGIRPNEFPTEWGTFAETAEMILSLPDGCLAATFDISAAYRITPVRPDQQNALCIYWRGKVYVDRALPFGLSSSAGVFGAIADMLVAISNASGFGPIKKWVDDFFVIRLPDQTWTESDFTNLTASMGVPWKAKKQRNLAPVQRYIGFDWDLRKRSVALPKDKLKAVRALVAEWRTVGAKFSARDAARLHGKLVHISTIFPLIRPFLPSATHFARNFQSARASLHPTPALQADLSWVDYLLHRLPNEVPLARASPLDMGWWGDASTSFGIGIVVDEFWAVWKWAPGFKVGPKQSHNIGWAEAVAVELGLRTASAVGLLAVRDVHASNILVRSDNEGVVTVVNKGRSRSRTTNEVLKHLYSLCADSRISLTAEYVPSRFNVTDALSRGDIVAFLKGFPKARTRFQIPVPDHLDGQIQSL